MEVQLTLTVAAFQTVNGVEVYFVTKHITVPSDNMCRQ